MNLLSYSRIILTVIHRSKATWSYLLASHLTLGRYSLIVSLSLELDDDVISTDLWQCCAIPTIPRYLFSIPT